MKYAYLIRGLASIAVIISPAAFLPADIVDSGAGFAIPDDDPAGDSSTIVIGSNQVISDVSVTLQGFTHTWIGDIIVTLTGPTASVDLMFRTGDAEGDCCGDSSEVNGDYTFADGGADWWAAAIAAGSGDTIAPGTYAPTTILGTVVSMSGTFGGTSTAGNWTLTISDNASGDTGAITGWILSFSSIAVPEPSSLGFLTGGWGLLLLRRRRRKV